SVMRNQRGARSLLVAVVCSVLLVATACQQATPGSSPAPSQGGSPQAAATQAAEKTFVLGVATQSTGCDGPQLLLIVITLSCPSVTQETLVNLDWTTNKATPALAVSWTEAPDSITFKLRQNVKFQDGTPFNADAVVFNFRRAFDKTFPANQGVSVPYASFVPYKSVEKIDD